MSARRINILGVTGSVGRCAMDVVLSAPEKFDVQVVSAQNDVDGLVNAALKLDASCVVIGNEEKYTELREKLDGHDIRIEAGREAIESAARWPADLTLVAIVGMAGLRAVLAALRYSKLVAIANKEPLAAAGPLVMKTARQFGSKILPVDSEHNAIFQVFDEAQRESIKQIILTASGGPFRTWSREQMAKASLEQALVHPNWSMGPKITIDSATMMNKALEIIEAHYLFDMPPEKIKVLIHPQSVVHSMVEYCDGSVLAQMGASDMRTPVAHVLGWPERIPTPGKTLDWKALKELTFEEPDFVRFPALSLAYEALKKGSYACMALNTANEIAVESFLNKKTGFLDTMDIVQSVFQQVSPQNLETIEDFEEFDQLVRGHAYTYITDVLHKDNKSKVSSAS